jgi:hypothetical protein
MDGHVLLGMPSMKLQKNGGLSLSKVGSNIKNNL